MRRPPALRPGARVALVAAAGPVPEGGVDRAVARVRALGWEPVCGAHCRGRNGYLAGTDEERLADLNGALRDPAVDAVWLLRGGYGTLRIVDRVDWDALADRPVPLVGFSDNTVLHLAARRAGVVAFHGPHPAAETLTGFSLDGLVRVLADPAAAGTLPFPDGGTRRAETLAPGAAEGPLVGGNLAMVAATLGTPYAPDLAGAVLFLEEVGEHAYRVDRLLSQLRLAGVLGSVAGVALGGFTGAPDDGADGLPAPVEVVRDRLCDLGIPVAWGFPFGHVDDNWTLPLGVRARLDADAGTLALLEPAVS